MGHYIIELIIWTLIAYFIGCFVGWLLRSLFGAEEAPASRAEPLRSEEPVKPVNIAPPVPKVEAAPPAPKPAIVEELKVPAAALAAAAPSRMERPKGIAAARGGKADDLQQISGIGPKNEKVLHNLGFFHFDQIAAWTESEISWVDDHLKFNGRIGREQWVHQAELLAAGKHEEFKTLYGSGGLKTAQGQTESGSRTRK